MVVKLERQPTRTPLDALSLASREGKYTRERERRMGEGGGHSIALRLLGETGERESDDREMMEIGQEFASLPIIQYSYSLPPL